MKTLLLFVSTLFSVQAFAAGSACQVMVVSNGQGGVNYGYNCDTTCDGKLVTSTPISTSISQSYTAALDALFAKGYTIAACTLESTETANGNDAIPGTYDCLLTR